MDLSELHIHEWTIRSKVPGQLLHKGLVLSPLLLELGNLRFLGGNLVLLLGNTILAGAAGLR